MQQSKEKVLGNVTCTTAVVADILGNQNLMERKCLRVLVIKQLDFWDVGQ